MPTNWTLPTSASQYSELGAETIDTAWNTSNDFAELTSMGNGSLQSEKFLFHSSRSPKLDVRNKTYFLQLTGYNFQNLPNRLSGISVRLSARRYGRATDDTIQLCLNGEPIGENRASFDILPQTIYGGVDDLWNADLNISNLQDPTFGVIIRFQAHREWPHKDPILIDAVEMQIY